jgi:catalase
MPESAEKLTTASVRPFYKNYQSVGLRGPLLLQDYILHEKMAHFNREYRNLEIYSV